MANMSELKVGTDFGLISYLAVFAVHIIWAGYVHARGLVDLSVGPVKGTFQIFFGLVLLNLPSVVVFLPELGMSSPSWILGHSVYHILLTLDEVVRVKNAPIRGVFLVNHLYWSLLLLAYGWTVSNREVFSQFMSGG